MLYQTLANATAFGGGVSEVGLAEAMTPPILTHGRGFSFAYIAKLARNNIDFAEFVCYN